MFGDDDESGILDRFREGLGSSIDEQEIWSEVKKDRRRLKSEARTLRSQSESLKAVDPNEIADTTVIAETAEDAADQATNAYQGAKLAVKANNETALDEDETYDIIESVQVKVEGLAEDLTESYDSVTEYGDTTYGNLKELLEEEDDLGVDIGLPHQVDWESGDEVDEALREAQSSYESASREFWREANNNKKETEKAEERAESYRQAREDLDGSIFAEEYGEIADTLEEKAEGGDPVTPAEKAEKAEMYASLIEFTREHLGGIQHTASTIDKAEERAYSASRNLASLLGKKGYSRENDSGEWRKVD